MELSIDVVVRAFTQYLFFIFYSVLLRFHTSSNVPQSIGHREMCASVLSLLLKSKNVDALMVNSTISSWRRAAKLKNRKWKEYNRNNDSIFVFEIVISSVIITHYSQLITIHGRFWMPQKTWGIFNVYRFENLTLEFLCVNGSHWSAERDIWTRRFYGGRLMEFHSWFSPWMEWFDEMKLEYN